MALLHEWLDCVVPPQEPLNIRFRPQPPKDSADATIPIDQRAVTVERDPAVAHRSACHQVQHRLAAQVALNVGRGKPKDCVQRRRLMPRRVPGGDKPDSVLTAIYLRSVL